MANNVRVIVRFRPISESERTRDGGPMDLRFASETTVQVVRPERTETFTFDRVFPPDTAQSGVYDNAACKSIEDVLKGFNATIFAYGQTGAGKSFTMLGKEGSGNEAEWGIIPRAAHHIFQYINSPAGANCQWKLQASYLEIYMEKINDLLDPTRKNLSVHENPGRGIYVDNLSEEYVTCEQDVLDLLSVGGSNRVVMATQMNAVSSRSHSVFVLLVSATMPDGATQAGKLNLVDLAGSERAGKTGATGLTFEQGTQINLSLSCLGNCIKALTSKSRSHVPYRDSKLTRILQESLGGNCKTTLICACSPHSFNADETMDTLRFAKRAKTIQTAARANVQRSAAELERIVANLKRELADMTAYARELEKLVEWYKSPDYKPGMTPPFQPKLRSGGGGSGDDDDNDDDGDRGGGDGGRSGGASSGAGGDDDDEEPVSRPPRIDPVAEAAATSALSEQLAVAERERMDAQNKLASTVEELQTIKQRVVELETVQETQSTQEVEVRRELSAVKAAMEETQSELVAERERAAFELRQAQSGMESAQSELASMRTRLTEAQSSSQRLEVELEAAIERQRAAETQLQEIQLQTGQQKSELEDAVARSAALQERMKELQKEVADAKRVQEELERETTDLHDYVAELEGQKDQMVAEVAEANANVRLRLQQMQSLDSQLKAAQARANEFEQQLSQEVADRQAAVGRMEAEVQKYKQNALDAESRVHQLRQDMHAAQAETQMRGDAITRLKSANADLEQTVGTLQAALQSLRQRGTAGESLSTEAAEMKERIERLSMELKQSAEERLSETTALSKRLEAQRELYDDQLRALQTQRDTVQQLFDTELSEAKARVVQAQAESVSMRSRAVAAEDMVEKLRKDLAATGDKAQQASAAMERLKLENMQLEARVQSEEARAANAMKRGDEKAAELASLRAAYDELKVEVESLRRRVGAGESAAPSAETSALIAQLRNEAGDLSRQLRASMSEAVAAREKLADVQAERDHAVAQARLAEERLDQSSQRIQQLETQQRLHVSTISTMQRARDENDMRLREAEEQRAAAEQQARELSVQNEALSKRAERAQRVFRPLRAAGSDDPLTRALSEKIDFGQHQLRQTENRFIEEARREAARAEAELARRSIRASAPSTPGTPPVPPKTPTA